MNNLDVNRVHQIKKYNMYVVLFNLHNVAKYNLIKYNNHVCLHWCMQIV
jgi:CDP-glycerol glycerophosphotransferase (TagB/SpsB family)